MSYTRGNLYIWVGGDDCGHDDDCNRPECSWLNIWVNKSDDTAILEAQHYGHEAGLIIRESLFDEYVVMRHAELVADGLYEQTKERAVAKYSGNAGAWDLMTPEQQAAKTEEIKQVFEEARKTRLTSEAPSDHA